MMSLPKSWAVSRTASASSTRTSASVSKIYTPIEASATSVEPDAAVAWLGFSWNPVTRDASSVTTMPKRWTSASGTSIVASVAAAPRSRWNRSMRS